MRDKVIKRLEVLFEEQGGVIGEEEFLSFPAPTTKADIALCTDEELIELLETNGVFAG